MHVKPRADKTVQDKTMQGNTRQGKPITHAIRHGKTMHDNVRQDNAT